MWTVLQVGENVNFVDGTFFQFGKLPEFLSLDTFDGNFLLGFEVDGLEYPGVDSRTQFMLKGIIFDNLSHGLNTISDFEIFIIPTSFNLSIKVFII
jgi:hypothetical protein